MSKRSDLFREYARVIDLCEGTKVEPHDCVKLQGVKSVVSLCFNCDPEEYTFALAIVEDKPVFAGDVLYGMKTGTKFTIGEYGMCIPEREIDLRESDKIKNMSLTWTKPDPFAELKQAKTEGKRIAFFDGANWIDTDSIDTVNFKPESYKVVERDELHKFTYLAPSRITCSQLTINLKKDGITGKITAEVIE